MMPKKILKNNTKSKTLDQKVDDLTVGFSKMTKTIDTLTTGLATLTKNVDNLAISTAKGFERINDRFEETDFKLNKIEVRLTNVEEGLRSTRHDILDLHDRFTPRNEFDKSIIRLNKLEQKLTLKK